MNVEEAKGRKAAALKTLGELADKADAESREFTGEEKAQIKTLMDEVSEAKKAIGHKRAGDVLREAMAGLNGGEPDPVVREEKRSPGGLIEVKRGDSIGRLALDSPEAKAFYEQYPNGLPQKTPFGTWSIPFKTLITGTSDSSAGALITPDRQAGLERLSRRDLTIRNLVSVRQTGSDMVEYVEQLTRVNAAAPVAEATTSAAPTAPGTAGALVLPAGGGYKPEGGFTLGIVQTNVKTIAEWMPATRRAMSDVAQLRGLIDDELRADLDEEEEDQILNGNGTGENLRGIMQTVGIQSQAYSATVTDLAPALETTYKAQTKVRVVGRSTPTGYVMNAADYEAVHLARLAKNPNNEAIGAAIPTLHGLPVVISEAMASGEALVGDFRRAVIWDRERASITFSDQHADFFIRNLVAILAEERLAFGVTRPAAFCKIDLTV